MDERRFESECARKLHEYLRQWAPNAEAHAKATIRFAAANELTRHQHVTRTGKEPTMRFLLNWLLTSIAIAIATFLVPGIQPFGMADAWVCFAFVGLFLNIVDSLVKPLLTVISLPLTIITLGIFQLVVNSFMLELASYLSVNLLGAGISIASFGSAFMGSILVSITRSIFDSIARN